MLYLGVCNPINLIFGPFSYQTDTVSFEILNIGLNQFMALDQIK